MRLIKKLSARKNSGGHSISYGLFYCECCNSEVEMQLSNGYKGLSCGCQKDKRKNRDWGKYCNVKERMCLMCGGKFISKGYGFRRCDKCKEKIVMARDSYYEVPIYKDSGLGV